MKYTKRYPDKFLYVFYTVVLSSLPHLFNISFFATVICLSLWIYIFTSFYRAMPMPGLRVRSVIGLFLFLISAGTHEGATVEAFVSLLIFMTTMKLFEVKSVRDTVITVILCYFTIVSGMFFNDSIFATIYIVFTLIFNTSTLTYIQFSSLSFSKSWRMVLAISIRSFPIMIILFLCFPRIETGFTGRIPTQSDYMGFTDELHLGSIAEIAENRRIAFRADFEGNNPPEPALVYWRNIVFWEFNGVSWQHGRRLHFSAPNYKPEADDYNYTITLEAHNERWLPSLDLPKTVHGHSNWLRHDYTIYRYVPVKKRISYSITSSVTTNPHRIPRLRKLALQLPGINNPRARSLANNWRSDSPQEVVRNALDYFRDNSFEYTYSQNLLTEYSSENPIDTFLFTTRKGYCEHFAASFAFLMRAAGVPARLVGGYLGGQINPYGDYLVVRQSNAHVWVEVLVDNEGWQRVDPTMVVNPSRFIESMDLRIDNTDVSSWLSKIGLPMLQDRLQKITYLWDLTNSIWNSWVMQYSSAEQNRLFNWLQFDSERIHKSWGIAIFLTVFGGAVLFIGMLFLRIPKEGDPIAKSWLLFREKLEKMGIPNDPAQGPVSLLETLQHEKFEFYKEANHIVVLYISIRYKDRADNKCVVEFTNAVKQFVKKS